jgi:hypothetical protein
VIDCRSLFALMVFPANHCVFWRSTDSFRRGDATRLIGAANVLQTSARRSFRQQSGMLSDRLVIVKHV